MVGRLDPASGGGARTGLSLEFSLFCFFNSNNRGEHFSRGGLGFYVSVNSVKTENRIKKTETEFCGFQFSAEPNG